MKPSKPAVEPILNKPDFLLVGPAKTGTAWLFIQLKLVEGVDVARTKELSFFEEVYFNQLLRKTDSERSAYDKAWLENIAPSVKSFKTDYRRHKWDVWKRSTLNGFPFWA